MTEGYKYISDFRLSNSGKFNNTVENLSVDFLKQLFANDPNKINQNESRTGWTFLHKTVMNNNYPSTEYLLKLKANPNIQNFYGETPLYQAVDLGNNAIINLLLENNADPNIQQKVYILTN